MSSNLARAVAKRVTKGIKLVNFIYEDMVVIIRWREFVCLFCCFCFFLKKKKKSSYSVVVLCLSQNKRWIRKKVF